MRTLILLTLASICTIIISSCDSQPKSRIESKFQNYVNENFGNPNDLTEIVSITKTDSFDVLQHINKSINEVSLDSLYNVMIKYGEMLTYLAPKLPSQKRIEIGKKVMPIISNLTNSLFSDMASYKKKKEELINLSENIDSTLSISRSYLIRARVRQKDDFIIKDYYAMDCCVTDSVIVSEYPIKTSDLPPQTTKVLTVLADFWAIIDKQLDINDVLLKSIKECQLYAN